MKTIEQITTNDTYKQVLADSFGGVMYDVANKDKYDTTELLALWDSLEPCEKENCGGIMTGAINFIK